MAKEEAAQERRRTIEAERLAKMMELDQRRREQEVKVEQMLLERDRAREEAAKEKAKYVTQTQNTFVPLFFFIQRKRAQVAGS